MTTELRCQFARSFGALQIVLVRPDPGTVPHPELRTVDHAGNVLARIAIKPDEQTRLVHELAACRDVTVGNPKQTGESVKAEIQRAAGLRKVRR